MEKSISIYRTVKDTSSTDTITVSLFLDAIKHGKWEDQVNRIRTISDEELRRAEKAKLPNVTVSGVFGKRVDADCKLHSGFIAIDIDGLGSEVESTKQLLARDPYIYAAFMSVSGHGICALFKIDPEQHKRAFEGIADYLLRNYQIVIDPTGVNVSRTRFVSHDPGLHLNEDALLFKKYLAKQKARKIQDTIFVQSEFDDVIKQMAERNISCVDDYRDWRDIGFGLADKFGEAGRQYFHTLSACSEKYEASTCDKQYTHCLRSNQSRGGSKVTIATIYWFAKQAGIQVLSEKTRKVAATTSTLKKSGLDAKAISENIKKFEGIEGVDDIIKQAFAANTSFTSGESLVESVRTWIKHNYQLRRNVITRKLENNGKALDEIDINTMFLDCKVMFEDINFDLFSKILFSLNTAQYNPILSFFEANKDLPRDNHAITRLFSCIDTPDDATYFGTKWLVSIIASVYGTHSPLMLILAGEKQGTGKTEFFRRLLPPELSQYYAESKLDAGKDDAILMTQKLIIMDDEMGGKSKKESKHLKELTSKQVFTLREPYGRMNVDLQRLAVLCGTTNDMEILNDLYNRRQIPIEVRGIDHEAYNAICKRTLIMEAWHLYQEGFEWEVKSSDSDRLAKNTGKFIEVFTEGELLDKYFEEGPIFMTTTEIKNRLETLSVQKLGLKRLGLELKRRFNRVICNKLYGYMVNEKNTLPTLLNPDQPDPF